MTRRGPAAAARSVAVRGGAAGVGLAAVLATVLAASGCPRGAGGGAGGAGEVAEPVPAEIEWPDAGVPRVADGGDEVE